MWRTEETGYVCTFTATEYEQRGETQGQTKAQSKPELKQHKNRYFSNSQARQKPIECQHAEAMVKILLQKYTLEFNCTRGFCSLPTANQAPSHGINYAGQEQART